MRQLPDGWWILPFALAGLLFWFGLAGWLVLSGAAAACEPEPVTANTPTGIAGCEVWGEGTASHYGPGDGVAMNWCTWEIHRGHAQPCGWATITSHDTGLTVTVPVVDFCDCYTGTADQRIVDLQYGVVAALGLDLSRGLYPVTVRPASGSVVESAAEPTRPVVLPDTAMPMYSDPERVAAP